MLDPTIILPYSEVLLGGVRIGAAGSELSFGAKCLNALLAQE